MLINDTLPPPLDHNKIHILYPAQGVDLLDQGIPYLAVVEVLLESEVVGLKDELANTMA